jgi:hypothetical protein
MAGGNHARQRPRDHVGCADLGQPAAASLISNGPSARPIVRDLSDVIEVFGDFLVRRYPNERAAVVQWDAVNRWVKRNNLSGIAMWRMQAEEGFFIVLFDLTGQAPEFTWSGEPFVLPDSKLEEFVRRAEEFVNAGGSAQDVKFLPGSRLRRTPDGRFAIEVNQG